MTTVVNIRKTLDWDKVEGDVYIGRPSKFGNLHRVGACSYCKEWHTREEAIALHRVHVRENPKLLEEVKKLKGKRLGCFCKPKACHGDIYVEIAEGGEKDGSVD